MNRVALKSISAQQIETPGDPQKSPRLKFKVGNKRSWVPPGVYEVKLNSVEMRTPFQNKPVLEFLFEIASGVHKGVELRGFCNADYETFSENTKLYQWYAAITGDELVPGDELDVEIFNNKVIEVEVEDKVSRKTKIKFSNVTNLRRVICEL